MTALWIVLIWIASLFLGAILGYDRGRWEMGMALGGIFGPLGAIAAGLLPPSPECEARRRFAIGRRLRELQAQEAEQLRLQRLNVLRKREDAEWLGEMVGEFENTLESRRNPLADGLEQLAGELDHVADKHPPDELTIRSWIGWLKRTSHSMRDVPPSQDSPPRA